MCVYIYIYIYTHTHYLIIIFFVLIILGGRQVFERWMEWQPEEQAWHSYINFELRYKELDRARAIYERYILFTLQELRKLCHYFVYVFS